MLSPVDCSCLESSIIMDYPNDHYTNGTSSMRCSTIVAMNSQNNVPNVVGIMSEDIKRENFETSNNVYIDTDEKPVVTMIQFEQDAPEAKTFICDVCNAVFCHSSSIKEHMLQHKRSRPQHCSKCDQYFVQGNNFSAHKQQHELENTVQCPVCSKRYKSVDRLTTHMKMHENNESYECGICCKLFGQTSSLVKHMENHTSKPLYQCDICLERVNTLNALEYHKKKVHYIYDVDMYPYKCSICEFGFKKRSELTEHDWETHFSSEKMANLSPKWRNVQYEEPAINEDHHVTQDASSVLGIQESMDICTSGNEIHICNESMNNYMINNDADIVSNEIATKNNEELKETGVKLSEGIVKSRCQDDTSVVDNVGVIGHESFIIVTEYKNNAKSGQGPTVPVIAHCSKDIKTYEEDSVSRESIAHFAGTDMDPDVDMGTQECESGETNGLKKYECDLCSLQLEGSDAAERHMLEHNKLLPHYCRRCDLYFVLARNMKTHMSQHEADDPLLCQLCNEIFYTAEGLNSHSLTHVENYPYQCDICQRGFQIRSAYDLHIRFHSNTVFQCSVCNKDFAYKQQLESHKRKEHFIYDKSFRFGCDLCKMKFKTKKTLRDHKRYVHKIPWEHLVGSKGVKHYFKHRRDRSKFV